MIKCPKCSGISISGPVYRDGSTHPTGMDSLEYWCNTCGYTSAMPCHDSIEVSRRNLQEELEQFRKSQEEKKKRTHGS